MNDRPQCEKQSISKELSFNEKPLAKKKHVSLAKDRPANEKASFS